MRSIDIQSKICGDTLVSQIHWWDGLLLLSSREHFVSVPYMMTVTVSISIAFRFSIINTQD